MKTCLVGEILEFDHELQLAKIKLNINEVVSSLDSNFIFKEVAPLVDIPCVFTRCGGYSITSPVKPGDQCVVFFTSKGITHWLYRGEKEYKAEEGRPEPAAFRGNSYNDAVAIVGISNVIDPIVEFQPDFLEIRNADRTQRLTLQPDGEVTIQTNNTKIQVLQDGTINIEALTEVNVTTPIANFSGDVRVEGNVNIGGDMSTDSKGSYNGHTHPKGDYKDAEERPLLRGRSGAI